MQYIKEIVCECDIVYPDMESFAKQYPFYDTNQTKEIWSILCEVVADCEVYHSETHTIVEQEHETEDEADYSDSDSSFDFAPREHDDNYDSDFDEEDRRLISSASEND